MEKIKKINRRIEASRHLDYKEGEWVLAYSGWQDYALSDGSGLTRLGTNPKNPSHALGILGMPGFTAYMGLLDIGRPKQGETLVVAAATGPVGATVGQIGKLNESRFRGSLFLMIMATGMMNLQKICLNGLTQDR
ncbi:hypothetical protein [Desulfobacula sp.]|uniref:hypothetical protein n=1 Tax=Desulfobacula sp. TaxID=2593537 RepID=UPI0039B8BF43